MAKISQFRKKNSDDNRDENTNVVDRHVFKKRIRAHKFRIFSVGMIVAIVAIVIIFIMWNSYYKKVYSDYEVNSQVDCHMIEGSSVLSYGTQFLTYSADGIHCTNAKGKDIWSVPFEMQNPMVAVEGDYIACADLNGRKIYVFNCDGELGEIKTGAPVKSLDVSGDGVVVVTSEDDEVTPIDVYYYDGSKIANFRTTMSKSGYPLAMTLSPNSKLFAVSYLYLDSGSLTTKLAMYNFGDVGKNETDNLVSGYDFQGEIIPIVDFMDNDTLYAVANDKLIFFEGKERPTNSASVDIDEEILAVYGGSSDVGLLFADATGEGKYRLDTYSPKGKLKSSIIFNLEYTDIFYANDMVVIYNSSSALVYRTNGTKKYAGDFKEPVALMIPTKSPVKYTLVTQEAIKSITLK